ncbi:hypothetical protein ASPCADRAFT_206507, partial [Aspergillus carbonarius ITEM 5010]
MFNRRLASRITSARVPQPITPATQTHTYLRPHLLTQHPTLSSSSAAAAAAAAAPILRFASTTTSTTSSSTLNSNTTPDITNHYTIFKTTLPAGPPPASPFDIPTSSLRREFLQWQSRIHPDKYPQGPQKQAAEALSARINEAYRTLLDPLQRAQYLLREMHGIDVTAEDGASKHALDAETLMEVMEVQETIEEVAGDAGAEARILELKRENEGRVEECVRVLGEAFDKGDIEMARRECV